MILPYLYVLLAREQALELKERARRAEPLRVARDSGDIEPRLPWPRRRPGGAR
jgi:hypothetical protein